MVLVDTSVWVDHFRTKDERLSALLESGQVATHPFVIGELSLGHMRQRDLILQSLDDLPKIKTASDPEVLVFIEANALAGIGIGYVDAHLLAAVRLTEGAALWTRDKRLDQAARRLGLAAA